MKLINLLFLFVSLLSCSQTKKSVDAIFIESIYKQTKVLQDDKQIENDDPETIFKYLYLINKTKDSVIFYDSAELKPISFVLTESKNKNEILLKINSDEENEDFKIIFNDKKNSLSINKDVFTLNVNYFNFLKQAILRKKNVLEFVDFSDDFLSEYSPDLQKLIYISTKSKYKNKDFKIIKANIRTKKEQTDNQFDNWNVVYKYDKDKLLAIKMFNINETRFEKQVIAKDNSLYSYNVSKNIEERMSSEETITFDLIQNKYKEEGSYLQVGINKETFYKSYLIREEKIQLENSSFFSREKIKILFTKYLP